MFGTDLSGYNSLGNTTGPLLDQYNTQNMLDFGTTSGFDTDLSGFSGATE